MMNTTREPCTRYVSAVVIPLTFFLCYLITPPASAGTITLISAPYGDHSERRCTLDIPPAGAGKTLRLSLADRGGLGTGNCYDMQPTDILMQNIPSAAEILLTDDWLCDTTLGNKFYTEDDPQDNKSFVIRLETTRNPSQLPEIGFDRLLDFTKGEYIDYTKNNGEKSHGFKLVEKTHNGAGRIIRRLSCLQITISDDADTPTRVAVPLGDVSSSAAIEEADSAYDCPSGEVMVGRAHNGDENRKTTYTCQAVKGNGTEAILFNQNYTAANIPECGRRKPGGLDKDPPDKNCTEATNYNKEEVDPIYFTCPTDTVMVGRSHEGDETGYTTYRCATLYKDKEAKENTLMVVPGEWEGWAYEYQSDFTCGTGKVMIGRAHRSDENGATEYRCGQLFYPTNPHTQVTP